MTLFLDSFWRALAYCLQPRVIALSFLPLLLLAVLSVGLFWLFWDPAVLGLQAWLSDWALMESLFRWLDSVAMGHLRTVLAPLLLILLVLPLVVVLSLLVVAWLAMPAIVRLVAERRFAALTQRHGGSFAGSLLQGLGSALLALLALVLTLPLWLIPPLVIVVPPLVWGWLTSRVMVYDALAQHASEEERVELMRRHRYWLLAIGMFSGYMGAAPGLIWAVGAMAVVLAPLLVPLAIWIYTFVFIFASLWFTHYSLAALAALRAEPLATATQPPGLQDAHTSTGSHV
ncbi:EI24 domain-containing protein [Curvibacter sp. PAE-UM]|uniref:EI24 domain-containing protein n=1 Tax=Curvibacter sp. PAE-UM TaxID=1714344 RepID=UPI00070AFF0D|nr:EI24 domain-containing protein [Curvibacter sp. PAE-UM]KRI00399.1 hypothetical protein AO057_14655 [Curvibacter sp. PAE-UM]